MKDKSGSAGESFSSIEDLTSRYKNLKEIKKNLVKEKAKIGPDGEKQSANEKKKWNQLKKKLFEEQRK